MSDGNGSGRRLGWDIDELIELHADNLTVADEMDLRRRIEGDDEARGVLNALDTTQQRLADYGRRNHSPRPVDFSEQFRSQPVIAEPLQPTDASDVAPDRGRRSWSSRTLLVAASVIVVIVVAVTAGFWVLNSRQSTGGSPDTPTPRPGVEVVSVASGQPGLARLDLYVPRVQSVRVYFGRLDAVDATIRQTSDSRIDPATLREDADVCAETVLAEGVPGTMGAIYALNLSGWRAVEDAPNQALAPPPATIHQQSLSPPRDLSPDSVLTGGVRIAGDAINRDSPTFTLTLTRQEGQQQTWLVGDQSVTCRVLN